MGGASRIARRFVNLATRRFACGLISLLGTTRERRSSTTSYSANVSMSAFRNCWRSRSLWPIWCGSEAPMFVPYLTEPFVLLASSHRVPGIHVDSGRPSWALMAVLQPLIKGLPPKPPMPPHLLPRDLAAPGELVDRSSWDT